MDLKQRFNLTLSLIFFIGLLISGVAIYMTEFRQANKDVLEKATMLMEIARYTQSYISREITPLLRENLDEEFLPASVPAYGVHRIFEQLRETYPEYTYGQRLLHPTNPHNRAESWEVDIINQFTRDKALKELIGVRQSPKGELLYRASPIKITSVACLRCHSDPEDAPESMLKIYGSANGFNWKLNEIIGAQIVTVPMKPSYDAAWNSVLVFLISGGCILLVLFFAINRLLHYLVTKPLNKLSDISERLSLNQLQVDELDSMSIQTTTREMNHLWDSIIRLRRSLYHALRLLDGEHLLRSVEKENAREIKNANSKDGK